MAETLYEEAHRCPSCEQPGTLLNKKTVRNPAALPGTTVETLECRNDRCPDFLPPMVVGTNTTVPGSRNRWMVQVNPDGSIPPKGSGAEGPKAFETVRESSMAAQRARDNLAYLAAQDVRGADTDASEAILRDLGGQLA
jgi:hypothetical protein